MKILLTLVFCLATLLTAPAATKSQLAALQAADDARIAAIKSPDRNKLAAIFSDELRYAHSSGVVDTKTSYLDVLLTGKTKYVGYDHVERTFTFPAPGIALMTGRARIQVETASGKMDNALSYLAVWREEKGQWRFLAWQSCKLPVPETKP